jgi:dimethylargininase
VTPGPNTYTHALVRPPGDSFAQAISSTRAKIDPARARRQHAAYCDVLRAAGFQVEALPVSEALPDSCFMQDPALVVAGQAVVCRMGATSRAGEPALVAEWLRARFPTTAIAAPGTLEGGDILLLPDRLLVGESARTNAAGIRQLAAQLAPAGVKVSGTPVTKYLHLLTAVTYVGHNTLLALADYASHPEFSGYEVIVVPPEEAHAADALGTGDHVILPEGHPKTTAALQARGFKVLATPMSEFGAADGGITCLALVW